MLIQFRLEMHFSHDFMNVKPPTFSWTMLISQLVKILIMSNLRFISLIKLFKVMGKFYVNGKNLANAE